MAVSKLLYSQTPDADLFNLVKQNDVNSLEELYNRHWMALVNAAFKRLGSREKAIDIVQNIFITVYKRRDDIQLTTSLKAYLHQALKFKIFNEYRAELIRTKCRTQEIRDRLRKIEYSWNKQPNHSGRQ